MSDAVSEAIPLSGRAAWWLAAWLHGGASPDDVLDAMNISSVLDAGGEEVPALTVLSLARQAGTGRSGIALPVEGDPCGLAGPAALNDAALAAGEALLLGEQALVPHEDRERVEWHLHPANRRRPGDVGEADRELRTAVLGAARRLAALDVASWRPEVADALIDLRRTETLEVPAQVPGRCARLAATAVRMLEVCALALADDGGALSAGQAHERRESVRDLEAAARRALVAACSPDSWPEP